MSFVDILIPLAGGLLLLLQPKAMVKKDLPPEQMAAKVALMRRLGVLLIGVAVVYAMVATTRPTR